LGFSLRLCGSARGALDSHGHFYSKVTEQLQPFKIAQNRPIKGYATTMLENGGVSMRPNTKKIHAAIATQHDVIKCTEELWGTPLFDCFSVIY